MLLGSGELEQRNFVEIAFFEHFHHVSAGATGVGAVILHFIAHGLQQTHDLRALSSRGDCQNVLAN